MADLPYIELLMSAAGVASGWLLYLYKKLLTTQEVHRMVLDKIDAKFLLETRLIREEMHRQEVKSAIAFPTRLEVKDQVGELKADIRDMIRPLVSSIQAIENHVRNNRGK